MAPQRSSTQGATLQTVKARYMKSQQAWAIVETKS